MVKPYLVILFTFCCAFLRAQNVGINQKGSVPNASAILDLQTGNSGNVGFLPPQASLDSTKDVSTIANPATGLFVYNTNATMVKGSGVGYYYWNGTQWLYLYNSASVFSGWQTTGNSGTSPGTYASPGANFLGTIDNQDFAIRTYNTERMRFASTANGGTAAILGAPVDTQVLTVFQPNSTNGIAINGYNTPSNSGGKGIGVMGITSQSLGYGIYGLNKSLTGTGVVGMGHNASVLTYPAGEGGAFIDSVVGVYAVANNQSVTEGMSIFGTFDPAYANYVAAVVGAAWPGTALPPPSLQYDVGVFGSSNNMGVFGTCGSTYAASQVVTAGVEGFASATTGYGVVALNSVASSTALIAAIDGVTPYALAGGAGVFTGTLAGAVGTASNAQGYGVYGTYDPATSASIFGVVGLAIGGALPPAISENIGVYGSGGKAGIVGSYNGQLYNATTLLSSAVFGISGSNAGYAVSGVNTAATGIAVVGIGANCLTRFGATTINGTGGDFNGLAYGLFVKEDSVNKTGVVAAIYTEDNAGNSVYINEWNSNTQYKINGVGTMPVSCTIKNLNNEQVTLHAPETPEFYIEDYGEGKLNQGSAHIDIDPILAKNIAVSEKHPLRVFIQLYDNESCKGVVVKNRSAAGFDVVELEGGSSNTPFMWHIVCNVKDEVKPNGRINHLEDLRFEPAPKPPAHNVPFAALKEDSIFNNGLTKVLPSPVRSILNPK